jgi:DNA repair exonuclease SbcCD ATPase subunit
MTSSATKARGGRQATWPRDKIITALRRYAELYGPDFTASAFSPSTAKWRDEPEAVERYYAGDPDGIGTWPSLNAIKSHFDGSFNAAREAAGLARNKPGPAKRRRADGAHRPIRGVSHAQATRTVYVPKADQAERLERLERKLARAEDRAARLELDLERSRASKRGGSAKTVTKTKTKTKTVRVTDDAAVVRAEKRAESKVAKAEGKVAKAELKLAEARATVDGVKRDLAEARSAATRLAARLERSEATITTLRAERRDLKREAEDATDSAAAAKTMLSQAQEALDATRAETRVVVRDAPEQAEIDAARVEAREARAAQRDAEVRAARAEREYRELAVAARGEERKLTKAELDEFRSDGPSGPALLAAALGELASVRKAGGNPTSMRGALRKIASAAVSWADRL